MAKDLLLQWISCASCQRRAVAAKDFVVDTKDAVLGNQAECNWPTVKADSNSNRKPVFVDVKRGREPTKVEKILLRGSELCRTEEFSYAELSYDKVIDLDPEDWRGYYGKVITLQGQGKHFKAFQACLRGCEKLPENEILKELKETTREEYKQSKTKPPEKPVVAADASMACPGDCPGSVDGGPVAPVPRTFTGKLASKEERQQKKDMMLNIFREQWERIGKAKETMGYAEYTQEQQSGLNITGGHRPMARPKDIDLPKDFRQPIGVVTSEHMSKHFNCECERLCISVHGDIFDVSDRPDKYGKEGPYYYFAGKDITWGLVTGNDSENTVNMFFDLFKMDEAEINKKLQCICSWTGFYETEYGKVIGRLAEFEAEEKLPPPPIHNDECVVQ